MIQYNTWRTITVAFENGYLRNSNSRLWKIAWFAKRNYTSILTYVLFTIYKFYSFKQWNKMKWNGNIKHIFLDSLKIWVSPWKIMQSIRAKESFFRLESNRFTRGSTFTPLGVNLKKTPKRSQLCNTTGVINRARESPLQSACDYKFTLFDPRFSVSSPFLLSLSLFLFFYTFFPSLVQRYRAVIIL